MRRLLTALLISGAVLALAAPASAKGPQEAILDGEGIAAPIDLRRSLDDETFWSLTDDLGYFAAIGTFPARPFVPEGDLGPMLTLTWLGPSSPTEDFDVTVELYPWAEDGGRIHVPSGQRTITGRPTVDSWRALPARVLPVLHDAGMPSRATLLAASAPDKTTTVVPAVSLVADEPAGPPWALFLSLTAAVAGMGAVALLLRRTRRTDPGTTVVPV
jgi:hypothetical protein